METGSQKGALRISASAGSGKTYSLTNLFLNRALRYSTAYTGIVAITFTNKAANELKDRIIKRLKDLSDLNHQDDSLDNFGFPDRTKLAARASEILQLVLHDFDNLKVTTIDSFFQSIFSQLAYEADLPPGLTTEVDISLIKKEVLEEGLGNMSGVTKKILIENLVDGIQDSGKDWRPVGYLAKTLFKSLFDDKVVQFHLDSDLEELSDDKLQKARQILRLYVKEIEMEIQDSASAIISQCEQRKLIAKYLDSDKDKLLIEEINSIVEVTKGFYLPKVTPNKHKEGLWYRKPGTRKWTEEEIDIFSPLLIRYWESKNETVQANYSLAKDLINHLSSTRLLLFFREILKQQNQRANRFILGEVKFLLKNIIGDSDVPYLFERLGNQIHTLLIDEFQDTDQVQWNVILPLAKTIIENEGLLAVVGDVKQSIYAWRGADSTLFKEGIDQSLDPISISNRFLETNYRSESRIVEFNNWLFSNLSQAFADKLILGEQTNSDAGWGDRIRRNYEDVVQKINAKAEKRFGGFVELRVRRKPDKHETEQEGETEETSERHVKKDWIVGEIKRLQDAGFNSSDIAILVRKNAEIDQVIQLLDHAQQTKEAGYDFTFSTGSKQKSGDKPLFQFLVRALNFSLIQFPEEYDYVLLESLARTLLLDTRFHGEAPGKVAEWRQDWRVWNSEKEPNLPARFLKQVAFFGLDQITPIQNDMLEFQNLLFRYIQKESMQYPDFFEWWEDKASQLDQVESGPKEGIRIMTVHKAKGLDFGVVILPISSTAIGDSLHKDDFWAKGDQAPWNSHALLKGKASSKLLKSDLADLYQNDVYKRALENLNTLYVACTRPTHGLIIDFELDTELEIIPKKSTSKAARIAFQIPRFILDQEEVGQIPFSAYSFDQPEAGDFSLVFKYGTLTNDIESEEKKSIPEQVQMPLYSLIPQIPWTEKSPKNPDTHLGILVHAVLEKTETISQWESILEKEAAERFSDINLVDKARQQLQRLFLREEFRNWFSGEYRVYPEQPMLSIKGNTLRADRILLKGDELILLDYKTGEESVQHVNQIRNYLDAVKNATGLNVKAFLIYSELELIKNVA